MLSLGKLVPGGQDYYVETVAEGAEEYYTGAKEAPGEWTGRSAARLGLTGEIDADTLRRVLEARDPWTGERLTRAQGASKVPGFDATFCAPKSVSLLFALGEREASNEVRNAHDAAVRAALGVLEGEAARVRRGKGGIERHRGEGFLGAAFRHRTSRAGDPQLHTHVVVANVVYAPHDGRWSALDARGLYGWAKTVGFLYEAQLRAELARRLGVQWGPVTNGIADLEGLAKPVLRAFSRRREAIEVHLEAHGAVGARAAQLAAYATRKAKNVEVPIESLLPEWRARAHALGCGDAVLAAVPHRGGIVQVPAPRSPGAELLFEWLASPDGLTERSASFGRRDVLQAISSAFPQGGDVTDILSLTDAFLASAWVVPLQPVGLQTRDVIRRRRDGALVALHVDAARWTTPEMLATEQQVITSAIRRQHDRAGEASPGHVRVALAARSSLSEEQARMVERITRSGFGVEVVEGVAGSGKTYALGAARLAWERSGYQVIGCALAARAAAELEAGSGIRSMTLARLLRYLDHDGSGLDPRTVVVVDEAAVVGTRTLAQLFGHAEAGRAKVVLVGDHRQLPEIDAGGVFAALTQRLDAVRLLENRRQIHAWERAALHELRSGDARAAFDAYRYRGRIRSAPDPDRVRAQLVDDWWSARANGQRCLMIAPRHHDVEELNRRARQHLRAAGNLGPDQLDVDGRRFAVGDEVLAGHNDYRLGVLNGTHGTITHIDELGGTLRLSVENGGVVDLPFGYVTAGFLTHAYATTIHKAQGRTVDQSFVLANGGLDRQRAYTALSRGSGRNTLYITEPDARDEHAHAPEAANDAVAQARAELARMLTPSLASDHWAIPPPEPGLSPEL